MPKSTQSRRRHDPRQPCEGLHRFIRSTSAAATIEYAALLAAFAGCLLVASQMLGDRVQVVFHGVISEASSTQLTQAASQTKPSPVDRALGVRPTVLSRLYRFRLLATELIAVAALGSVWYLLRSTRKHRELLGDSDEVPRAITQGIKQSGLFKKRQLIYRLLATEMQALLSGQMVVRHVMSKEPTTVLPTTSTDEIAERLAKDKFRHLLVCDKDRNLVGIISDRDLMRQKGPTAAELMTADPFTVTPSTLISPAMTLMIEKRISCLPVVDEEGQLLAVLTTTDLMMALQCVLQVLLRLGSEQWTDKDMADDSTPESDNADTTQFEEEPAVLDEQPVTSGT